MAVTAKANLNLVYPVVKARWQECRRVFRFALPAMTWVSVRRQLDLFQRLLGNRKGA